MSEPRTSASQVGSVRRWRLSRPGRPLSGPGAWFSRAPWIVLVLAMGLMVLAVVWPMPTPPVAEAANPPSIPSISERQTPVAERERTLASLTTANIFAKDGRFWLAQVPPDTGAPPGTDPAQGGPGQNGAPGAPITVLTPADPLPVDIKPAFENLRLVGVYTGTNAEPIAMLVRVTNLTTAITRSQGEEFIDDAFPQAPWRIVEIDAKHDRIVLERAGKHVALAMYANEPIPVVSAPVPEPAPPDVSVPGLEVVRATEEEIMRDLRAAGVDEKDIAALTELLKKDPEAMARAQGEAAVPGAQEQPGGLTEVFKLMQQAAEQKNAPPPKDPPPPG